MLHISRFLRISLVVFAVTLPLWATFDRNGDGISDIWSALHPVEDGADADSDGDGQTNRAEAVAGTAPGDAAEVFSAAPHTDGDGNVVLRWVGVIGKSYHVESSVDLRDWLAAPGEFIGTGAELSMVVRPAGVVDTASLFWRIVVSDRDTDGDGLNDWEEAQIGTDPAVADSDADGLRDADELVHGTDPMRGSSANDGIADGWKVSHGFDPNSPTLGGEDPDDDGRDNLTEYQMGSDPNDFFNGELPVVSVLSGPKQSPVDGFLAEPFVFQVCHADGLPWANAPISLDVDFGKGLWAIETAQQPQRRLRLRVANDGRVSARYWFSLANPVAPVGDLASVTAGSGANSVRETFLPVDASVGVWDLWYEDYEVEARFCSVEDRHIGFTDLTWLPYSNGPAHGEHIRYFRRQYQHFRIWDGDETGYYHDNQEISVLQCEDGVSVVLGSTSFRDTKYSNRTGSGTLQLTVKNGVSPRSHVVVNDPNSGDFDGIVTLSPGPRSSPYGSYYNEANKSYLPDEAPTEWSADHALFGSGLFEISLSEEDTESDLRARFARSKEIADRIADLPMGTARYVENGGGIIKDTSQRGYPFCSLLYLESFDDLAQDANYQRYEFKISLPEGRRGRVPGVELRARFAVLFYDYDDPEERAEPRGVFECVLNESNNWESPVFSIPPEINGYTEVEPICSTVETSAPCRLIAVGGTAAPAVPAEFTNTRPVFVNCPVLPVQAGDAPLRPALANSLTLQPVFLRDEFSFLDYTDFDISITWAVTGDSTAQLKLWLWHEDGSSLGIWSELPLGTELKPYFGSPKDHLFFQAVTPGWAVARFTTTFGSYTVSDDIRVDAAVPMTQLAVDGNRDGEIKIASEDDSDATSAQKPFRFWINDDDDGISLLPDDKGDEGIPVVTPDCSTNVIGSQRGLEDFARLWISTQGLNAAFTRGDMFLGLKWEVTSGAPAIKVFQAVESDGGDAYLKDASSGGVADQQTGKFALIDERYSNDDPGSSTHTTVGGTDVFVLPTSLFANLSDAQPKTFLLFEGCSVGEGQLKLVILDKNKQVIGEGPGVWMDLCNIKSMYVRTHTTPTASLFEPPYKSDHPSYLYEIEADGALRVKDENIGYAKGDGEEAVGEDGNPVEFPFVPAWDEDKGKCVVFVHGISLTVDAIRAYSESFVKRLWWEGFRGRFVVLRWGTPIGTDLDQLQVNEGPWVFSDGEMRSWAYGNSLKKIVADLRKELGASGVLSVAGHSLGNACVGSALRQGMVIDNYVLMEAAVPMMCYHAPVADPQNDPLRGYYLPILLDAETTLIKATFENYAELGYRGYLQSIADNVKRRVVNYHNRSDYWLATGDKILGFFPVDWVSWQRKYKPFQISWAIDLDNYCYAGWNEIIDSGNLLPLRPVRSPYEAMSFIARSRTRAVGGEPAPDDYGNGDLDDYREGGPAGYPLTFQGQRLDLKAVYGFGSDQKDHSGQFLRNIQELYSRQDGTRFGTAFYRQLMEDLQVVP